MWIHSIKIDLISHFVMYHCYNDKNGEQHWQALDSRGGG
jgi:hypothetical protein